MSKPISPRDLDESFHFPDVRASIEHFGVSVCSPYITLTGGVGTHCGSAGMLSGMLRERVLFCASLSFRRESRGARAEYAAAEALRTLKRKKRIRPCG